MMGETPTPHETPESTTAERLRALNADLQRITTELTQVRKDMSDYPELFDDERANILNEALTQARAALEETITQLRQENEMDAKAVA